MYDDFIRRVERDSRRSIEYSGTERCRSRSDEQEAAALSPLMQQRSRGTVSSTRCSIVNRRGE